MKDFLNQRPAFFRLHQSVRRRREGHPARVPFFICIVMMVLWLLRREWFGAVNSEIHAYKTVSADPYGSEDFQAFKDDKSDALKVLYCVNQLNEAVHVKGVDAIVMVRPTKSPTVFYQQLGRVLSSGGNRTPLVFDFCNNFGSIVISIWSFPVSLEVSGRMNEGIRKGALLF